MHKKLPFSLRGMSSCLGIILMSTIAMNKNARADESPFGYLYTTDTLPKGHWEYEQWNTLRIGKAEGSYSAFDLRNEMEYGFTDRFSASLYVNSSYLYTNNVPNPDESDENLVNQNNFDINGLSVELKYRVLSPYKNFIGLMLYAEPEISLRSPLSGDDIAERSIELKLILQKNFLDDRLVLASNIMFEPEWERAEGEREKELKNEYSFGASYRFAPAWSAGLEVLNRRTYEDQNLAKQTSSAFFLGPTLHYANKSWWTSLTVLPQIGGVPRNLGEDANGQTITDPSRTLGEYEKTEVRLRFGFNFE